MITAKSISLDNMNNDTMSRGKRSFDKIIKEEGQRGTMGSNEMNKDKK